MEIEIVEKKTTRSRSRSDASEEDNNSETSKESLTDILQELQTKIMERK